MFWPIVLPAKITFWILSAIVVLATALAPAMNWRRSKTIAVSSVIACLAFIPSCAGIMALVDTRRFGLFEYKHYSEVDDFRIERYLPTQASNITLDKYAAGHRAKYSISQAELKAFLDSLWDEYGQYSAISRDDLKDGAPVSPDSYAHVFEGMGWPLFEAVEYHSPVQGDGGGATYYFDPSTETAYHRAGYW